MAEKKIKTNDKKQLSLAEAEKIVLDLAKQGLTSEKIGLILRDKHKTNLKSLKTKISRILKKSDQYKSSDIENLAKKIDKLKKHMEKNKRDYKTRISFMVKSAKLKKLKKSKK